MRAHPDALQSRPEQGLAIDAVAALSLAAHPARPAAARHWLASWPGEHNPAGVPSTKR